MKCIMCNKEVKNFLGLGPHINRIHKISSREYYDRYLRNYAKDEGFCLECGKETSFLDMNRGYCKYCSTLCKGKSNFVNKKISKTNIKKSKDALEKRKITNLKKYGVENPYQSEKIKEKIREINLKRYEVEHPLQCEEIKDKFKRTLLNKNNIGYKNNLPLFKFYAPKIGWVEEVRRSPKDKDILEVKCKKCNEWFVPKILDLQNRLQALNGNRGFAEQNLYCSDKCKTSCSIYGKRLYQEGTNPNVDRPYQTEWAEQVKQNANFICEICGNTNDLVAHHILPVKTHSYLQADIDNGICLCNNCHYKYGHQDECSTGNLARKVC